MRKNVFAVRAMSKSVKMRVYAASVLSVLLYGSETWNCTAADIKRLESFHNRCLRCMYGISRLTHFTNFDLRKLTGQQTIQSMMMTNRLRWLGHVMRMSNERMPKRMMFARLQTARPQGGTRQRWKDGVQHDLRCMGLEPTWAHLAGQRDKWHAATERGVKAWEAEKNAKEQADYEQKKAGIGVKCPHCPYIAKNEKGLKLHFGHKHKFVEDLSDDSDDDDEDDDEPPRSNSSSITRSSSSSSAPVGSSSSSSTTSRYTCEHCGKPCSTGSGLWSHLNKPGRCKAAAETPSHVKKKAS